MKPTALIFRKELLPYSETFIAAQAKALARYRPVLVGYKSGPAGDAYLAGCERVLLADYTHSLELRKLLLKAFGNIPRTFQHALRDASPTLMHAHFGTNAGAAIPIARRLRLPLIVTFHGADISKVPRTRSERRRRAHTFHSAQRIIAVSNFIAEKLIANGCPPEKITRHHIGVDTDLFHPGDPQARSSRSILFVGRLVPKKGLIHLIRALPDVQRRLPDTQLIVIGDGALRESLEREAASAGIAARFMGAQPPEVVRELMRKVAVVCIPSVTAESGDAEGLPMSVVEAQASGTPIVASPSGGTAEGVIAGVTGFIAPSGDEHALAAHLIALLENDELRNRFSVAARQHVLEHFDLRKQTALLEQIYDEVRRDRSSAASAAVIT